jgi:multidrug resistance efflux pump
MADPTPTPPAEAPETKPPRDTEEWRKIAGRILSIVLIVAMVALALWVWSIVERHPRTDDAIAQANVIGVAPRVSGKSSN